LGRQFAPERYVRAHQRHDRLARRVAAQLQSKGMRCYAVDIRETLIAGQGRLTVADIQRLTSTDATADGSGQSRQDSSQLPASKLYRLLEPLDPLVMDRGSGDTQAIIRPSHHEPAARYPEWDYSLQGYLDNHTGVHHRMWPVDGDQRFYRQTLVHHRGLIASMRRAFEMLRPEGLTRLRRWADGDEFDYRALIDHRIEKRAGRSPSDRVYTKALKKVRDVAVLLLVDMSRSTSQPVSGTGKTVLTVEKEAVVLFCEALDVVGDRFAIAGFSGNGPLQVDYFAIKDFSDPTDDRVHRRIGSLTPQRNTRLGAAIRHATVQIIAQAARIKILILLSDGFPNDLGYKKTYAIRDTRKALLEAHASGIHTHALTVNIAADSRLDSLYGNFHHNLIADVSDLPGTLVHVYSALTRN
jgi:nitric oxide reductase activation protein